MVKYNNNVTEYIMTNPGAIKLGDVIDFGTGEVERNLEGLNIEFETEEISDVTNDDATSQDNTSEGFKFSACVDSSTVNAGGLLSFEKADSVFIRTKGIKISRITLDSLSQLGIEIEKRYASHDWPEEWCIVSELRYAKKGIIVASKSSDASIELKYNKSNTPIGINQLIDCNIEFGSETAIAHKSYFEGDKYVSVAYKLKGINKKFLRPGKFGSRGVNGVNGVEDASEYLVDYNPK